ncbi:MAG: trigger factor [Dehalobacter sp. 4CP]|uniref:FKBP-type peptidyl-prolyl cis-trans isomerase n=1 Tax=Dehalobacter sp. CP TaxID=2594474 RepID=UPI0013C9589B|nr:trigger factor [Dehalobacter sp. 4CP]
MAVNMDVRNEMKQFQLGQYKGLNVDRFDVSVKEEELNEALNYVKKSLDEIQVEKNDKPIETGDYVIVNFEGTENGKIVPKSRDRGFKFRVGDENFIEEFSTNLLGKKTGETVIFQTTVLPDLLEYQALWGKQITFSVEIVKVYRIKEPELTDDIVREIDPQVETLQEFEIILKDKILQEKVNKAQIANMSKVIGAIAENCKYEFEQEILVEAAEDLYRKFVEELKAVYNMELIVYLIQRKLSSDELLNECKEEASKRILGEKILDAVIKAEGIQLTDKEMLYEKVRLQNREKAENVELSRENNIQDVQCLRRKAMDFLLEANLAQ